MLLLLCAFCFPKATLTLWGYPFPKHRLCPPTWECTKCFIKATDDTGPFIPQDSILLMVLDGCLQLRNELRMQLWDSGREVFSSLTCTCVAWRCRTQSCAAQTGACQAEARHLLEACWKCRLPGPLHTCTVTAYTEVRTPEGRLRALYTGPLPHCSMLVPFLS